MLQIRQPSPNTRTNLPNKLSSLILIPESEAKGKHSEPTIRNTINLDDTPSSPSILKDLPPKAQETHVVYTKIQKMARNANVPFGYFNHTSWQTQQDPRVPLIALPRSQWDKNQFSFTTGKETQWVDLVVNNLDEGPHPFHLVSTFLPSLPLALDTYIPHPLYATNIRVVLF